jgi:CDP-diglyceride synthetase
MRLDVPRSSAQAHGRDRHVMSIGGILEQAVEKLAIIGFFVTGVSHMCQPRVWAQFFIDIRNKGETGSFINAFIHFPLGAVIVAFHNVWRGAPLVLTLIGCSLLLKSVIYFVFPKRGLKNLSRVSLDKSWEFVVAGVFSIALSIFLLFVVMRRV